MIDNQIENGGFSFGNFNWWFGVVEKRDDPEKLGRLRVRILGYNSPDTSDIKSEKLIWAYPIQPIVSSAMNGIGLSPTGIVEGTWVFGFYRDGHFAQDPVILGTAGGIPSDKKQFKGGDGFIDPLGTYPRDDFIGESDTNRLARNDPPDDSGDKPQTILEKQKSGESQKVPIALEGLSKQVAQAKQHKQDVEEKKNWTEKVTTYNALYPFNHVKETESGHIEEWDDTRDAERFKRWHRCGTFIEEHNDGDVVRRVKRNNYELIMGENFVQVIGDCSITIGAGDDFGTIESDEMDWTKEDSNPNIERGEEPHLKDVPEMWDEELDDDAYVDPDLDVKKYKKAWKNERNIGKSSLNLLVKGDVNLEVEGDRYEKVHGKMELYVEKDLHIKSGGTIYADGGPDIHLNKPGPTLDVESIASPDWSSNKKGRIDPDEQ
jgi:hypothetical protein